MRLFFALWPDEAVRAQLAGWARALHVICGGRATRAENLHLTLAFLGSVDEARVAEVERAAGEVAPRSGLLVLDTPGFWKRNRIAWAGASAVPTEIESLVRDLREALGRSRIGFDPKGFVSHVTLLRNACEPRAMPELEPIRWRSDGFVLAKSATAPSGRYEILNSWRRREA
jgi:2'-5' RNA ligase